MSVRGEESKDSISVFYEMVTALSGDQPPVVMVNYGFWGDLMSGLVV